MTENSQLAEAIQFFKTVSPNPADYCVCIGSAAMDISGYPESTLKLHDSNPGKIFTSSGGVSNNIAQNLARLKVNTKLLTCIGNDVFGERILAEGQAAGVDVSHVKCIAGKPSATYMALLDEERNMHAAIAHMDVLENITPAYLEDQFSTIMGARAIECDASTPEETIAYLCEHFKSIPIFLDPVSTAKGMRLKNHLNGIHTVKPNLFEASALSGISLEDPGLSEKAVDWFLEQGVTNVLLSMGKDGVLAASKSERFSTPVLPTERINSLSGAGDAFMAGLVYAHLLGANLQQATCFALGMSAVTIQALSAVNREMCLEKVLEMMAEN